MRQTYITYFALDKVTSNTPPRMQHSRWGLDAIKTRGESVAIALALVGARPVKEATGRVVKYELVPLSELKRPRIDVLASLSGIFRDSFANVVDLLDDLFETAAAAAEVRACVCTHDDDARFCIISGREKAHVYFLCALFYMSM